MKRLDANSIVGVLGAGVMGAGIAQLVASKGHKVVIYDSNDKAIARAYSSIEKALSRQVERATLTAEAAQEIRKRVSTLISPQGFADCAIVIEAVLEDLQVKTKALAELEAVVDEHCVLASNTSSFSVSAIAANCKAPFRVVGMHFFNPAPLMPLVELVPGIVSDEACVRMAQEAARAWGKTVVRVKDTPGFIVNRVARPFYGEALKMLEEGMADVATIDWAMREIGGFRMGPFELMDLIGNDVNYRVSESIFEAFYYDPRFRPSITQKRLVDAGFLGRKNGRGYYDYTNGAQNPEAKKDKVLGKQIFMRILVMLIPESTM